MTIGKATKIKIRAASFISSVIGDITRDTCPHTLMYHSICKNTTNNKNLYKVNKDSFMAQIKYLSFNVKCKVVSFSNFNSISNSISITFDDGYYDTLAIAAPILQEYDIPFTVFVTPKFLMSGRSKYLNKSSLQQLAKVSGCTIGAHGYSHIRLTECSNRSLYDELTNSKHWIEDTLSMPVNSMSYPHGAVDNRVRDAAEYAGYKIAASSIPGGNCHNSDKFQLKRTDIWSTDNVKTFASKVDGRWDWLKYL